MFLFQAKDFKTDDVVSVIDDVAALARLQANHGDWTPTMKDAAGKTGRVVKVYSDGDVRVKIAGNVWTFNPACLRIVKRSANLMNNDNDVGRLGATNQRGAEVDQLPGDVGRLQLEAIVTEASRGNVDAVWKLLTSSTSSAWRKADGSFSSIRRALREAACSGHLEVVKLLAERFPDQVMEKCDGKTALHVAASNGHGKDTSLITQRDLV